MGGPVPGACVRVCVERGGGGQSSSRAGGKMRGNRAGHQGWCPGRPRRAVGGGGCDTGRKRGQLGGHGGGGCAHGAPRACARAGRLRRRPRSPRGRPRDWRRLWGRPQRGGRAWARARSPGAAWRGHRGGGGGVEKKPSVPEKTRRGRRQRGCTTPPSGVNGGVCGGVLGGSGRAAGAAGAVHLPHRVDAPTRCLPTAGALREAVPPPSRHGV